MIIEIGRHRIGVRPRPLPGHCPVDGARGVFRRTALVCPACGRLLGGI